MIKHTSSNPYFALICLGVLVFFILVAFIITRREIRRETRLWNGGWSPHTNRPWNRMLNGLRKNSGGRYYQDDEGNVIFLRHWETVTGKL